jgi:hypothetical protein
VLVDLEAVLSLGPENEPDLHIRQAVPSKVRHHLPTRDANALIVMTKM